LGLYDVIGDKARGEALDFAHAAPLLGGVEVHGAPVDEVHAGDVCILTAGVKQHPGQSRLDLLQANIESMSRMIELLARRGLPQMVIVVTNPVDVMTELARRQLAGRNVAVLGSGTYLDSMRLRHALATRLAIAGESVHAHVVGEHGDSSVPLLDSAHAGGTPLHEALLRLGTPLDDELRATLQREVRGAAATIIGRKGATSHAIGVAVSRIVRACVDDERVVLPASAPVANDLCAGVPCILDRRGATPIGYPPLSAWERQQLDRSLEVLRSAAMNLPRRLR
jgi:L-lactate dehydrogenase